MIQYNIKWYWLIPYLKGNIKTLLFTRFFFFTHVLTHGFQMCHVTHKLRIRNQPCKYWYHITHLYFPLGNLGSSLSVINISTVNLSLDLKGYSLICCLLLTSLWLGSRFLISNKCAWSFRLNLLIAGFYGQIGARNLDPIIFAVWRSPWSRDWLSKKALITWDM